MTYAEPMDILAASKNHEVLYPGFEKKFGRHLLFTNIRDLNPKFGDHMLSQVYAPAVAQFSPLCLASLRSGVKLFGGGNFLLGTEEYLIDDRIEPLLRGQNDRIRQIITTGRTQIQIDDEALIAVRYGIYTWGHWLGELLPQIVLTEDRFPGRFKYVLPESVVADRQAGTMAERIRETLSAYSINLDRIIPVNPNMNYIFNSGYAVNPVWSDGFMNPIVSRTMRNRIVLGDEARQDHFPTKLAISRIPQAGRQISNLREVETLLTDKGFSFIEVGSLSFLQQVCLFRSASTIWGVLGSDLTNLIYSPDGVAVISAAPHHFGDRFFYGLVCDRDGIFCDIRGAALENNIKIPHRTSFFVPPRAVKYAVECVEAHKDLLSRDPQRGSVTTLYENFGEVDFVPEASDADLSVSGWVDAWDQRRISGWVVVDRPPIRYPSIELVSEGQVTGVLTADGFRKDILSAGIRDGKCGFSFETSGSDISPSKTSLRIAGTDISLRVEAGGRIRAEHQPWPPRNAQRELLNDFGVVVNIEHDHAMIGDSLCVIPFALALAERYKKPVHITGMFNKAVRSLIGDLPIIFDSSQSKGHIQFNVRIKENRDFAGPRGLHVTQAPFVLAKMMPPSMPLEIPLAKTPSKLPRGIVICPFTASEAHDSANHTRAWFVDRWLAVVSALIKAGRMEPVYLIGGYNDDVDAFKHPRIIPIIGQPLSLVMDLMCDAAICITVDTGPSHMAHFGGIVRHLLLYPAINSPQLATNPWGKFIHRWPQDITVDEVVAEALRMIE